MNSVDLVIIGGGISGLGVLRAASERGYRTVLFEKGEIARATSASSLRIIHGGFRYLQSLDIPRVLESCRDQQTLLRTYPADVKVLPCVMPLRAFGFKSRYPIIAASLLYRALSHLVCNGHVYAGVRERDWVRQNVPLIEPVSPRGVLYWDDALLLNPGEFTRKLHAEVISRGGVVREHAKVTAITPFGDFFEVEVATRQGIERICAAAVVNTSGPWMGGLYGRYCPPKPKWCKAFNVILNRQFDERFAVGLPGPRRLYFLVPRDRVSVLGTEYIPFEGNPDSVVVTDAEVDCFLQEFNAIFPSGKLSQSDVAGIESGVLPMRGLKAGYPRLFGMEQIYQDAGYIEVLSTKFTTFQAQARKVVNRVARRIPLEH